ncbi:interferon-induced transmembrane protein 2-like [Engystomops pustulosus]|uniref:interferon-induced transmembrane protein 2-like n=1 Tax=Engystomops pustulosus TaxID=76066 RepID=UPI003AFA6902
MERKTETDTKDPKPPPECPPYSIYPLTYINLGSPPPYSLHPSYSGAPQSYQTQPPAYVVTNQPYMVAPTPPVIRDHLHWSIINLIFCNVFLGIFAVVFSAKTRSSIRFGHSAAASSYSRTAAALNIIGVILGVSTHIIWISWIIYWALTREVKTGSFHGRSENNHYDNYDHYNG